MEGETSWGWSVLNYKRLIPGGLPRGGMWVGGVGVGEDGGRGHGKYRDVSPALEQHACPCGRRRICTVLPAVRHQAGQQAVNFNPAGSCAGLGSARLRVGKASVTVSYSCGRKLGGSCSCLRDRSVLLLSRALFCSGSDSEEVGSKGNAGSTFGDQGEPKSECP